MDDSNLAAGVVTTSCTFGATGSFSGTVTETADTLNYFIEILDTFQGSASAPSFVTGSFSLSGAGDLYPFISLGGQLLGPTGVLTSIADSFELMVSATNFLGSGSSATVTPMLPGDPLPQALPDSLGNSMNGSFTGLGTLMVGIDFSTDSAATYSFANSGLAVLTSTDPVHVVPEPSTLILLASGALASWLRWRGRSDYVSSEASDPAYSPETDLARSPTHFRHSGPTSAQAAVRATVGRTPHEPKEHRLAV